MAHNHGFHFDPSDRPMVAMSHEDDVVMFREAAALWATIAADFFKRGFYQEAAEAKQSERQCLERVGVAQLCANVMKEFWS